jgi:hypothetical protein
MINFITMSLGIMGDSSGAITVMKNYVTPTMQILTSLAAIASVFFIVYGGILYMTSSGRPEKLDSAKHILKNALIGLVIVLGAGTLTAILSGAMTHTILPSQAALPSLGAIEPVSASNGLIDILINTITGLLNVIIQTIAAPFLGALDFFTKATPLMSENSSVFNLWLAMVGITDALFVVVVALIGFHVMSAATFGLDEIEFKHLLPRIGLIFLFLNTSIFIIDGVIELSNALIMAISHVSGSESVWGALTAVVKDSGGQSIAALMIMLVFIIFSFILLIYYVGRLVTLFIGAVLSPLVILVWLVPGFRDFSETAMKTYLTTIFVLFVHVVILQLAASLFVGMSATSGNDVPNVLMSMAVGLATVMALLKTQGLMMQFSYVSLGARSTRQLGTQFMNGVSYIGGRGKAAVSAVSSKVSSYSSSNTSSGSKRPNTSTVQYTAPKSKTSTPVAISSVRSKTPTVTVTRVRAPTSMTTKTPRVNPTEHPATITPISSRQQVISNKTTKKEDKVA